MHKVKVSELPIEESLEGLYTLGVNAQNESVKVSLEFVKDAADNADAKAQLAEQAASSATTAATAANTAADLANEKAELADEKATLANEKATLANEKAQLADEKATLADEKAGLANTAAGSANAAATNANEKAGLANEAAGSANAAASNANEKATLADTKAGEAQTATTNANAATLSANAAATNANNATTAANTATQNAIAATEDAQDVVREAQQYGYLIVPSAMNVVCPEEAVGGERIEVTYEPEGVMNNTLFISSDESVLKVDKDGVIEFVSEGVADVKIVPTMNTSISQTKHIIVNKNNKLRFIAEEENSTISYYLVGNVSPDIKYSRDGEIWTQWDGSEITLENVGDILYIKGNNSTLSYLYYDRVVHFSITKKIAAYGSIMCLLDDGGGTLKTINHGSCFAFLFLNCTGLTKAPELPATTLADYCYRGMFSGCTSLTEAPELPATKLTDFCYSSMFSGCTGLTKAPDLISTKGSYHGYDNMFSGCTLLKYIKCSLVRLTNTGCTKGWLTNVGSGGDFYGTSLDWENAVEQYSENDGIPSGWEWHYF